MKRILYSVLGLILILLVAAGGAVAWLMNADLKPLAERLATDALGRRVSADRLEIGWGDPIHVELQNLRVANADWGSVPEMITLQSFSADVDPYSLWQSVPRYERLRAVKPVVVLERDEKGVGNWKFGTARSGGGFALIPKNRAQFPTLLDMALEDGLITYRTYSGNILRIKLDRIAIQSAGDDTPVSLKANGAYNNTPLSLDAKTQSFRIMRDAATPFGTVFTLAGKTARIDFDGTMMEPLDFEGVDGAMKLHAQKLGNLLASFGVELAADFPLIVGGHLTRKGDHWELTTAKGKIAENDFTGRFILDEGSKGEPDDIATDLLFQTLDLDQMVTAGQPQDYDRISLLVPHDTGVNLDAKIAAKQFRLGKVKLSGVNFDGSLGSGSVVLRKLSFGYAGGRASAAAEIKSTEEVSDIKVDATADGIDADRLAQEFGADPGDLTGRLDGILQLEMNGATVGAAMRDSSGAAILSMTDGSIRHAIIEKASTDLRSLFREKEGSSPITCLGGILHLENGVAVVAPLRLETKDANLAGSGRIDFGNRKMEIGVKSERSSTGFFALDLPVRISGSFDNLQAGLAGDAEKEWAPAPAPGDALLGPDMRQLAARNPCLD